METPKMGSLLFSLIQNMRNEYPEHVPYGVIRLQSHNREELEGYSGCDEYGHAPLIHYIFSKPEIEYVAADQDTLDAWLGEKRVQDDRTFLKIYSCPELEDSWNDFFDGWFHERKE